MATSGQHQMVVVQMVIAVEIRVPAFQAMAGRHVQILMSALLDHIDVHLMLHAQIQMAITAVPAILDILEVDGHVIEMNAILEKTHVPPLLHVQIQLDLIHVPAILATLEMGTLVLTKLSVPMAHIHVPLMLHVPTQLDRTPVPAILASLEMGKFVMT